MGWKASLEDLRFLSEQICKGSMKQDNRVYYDIEDTLNTKKAVIVFEGNDVSIVNSFGQVEAQGLEDVSKAFGMYCYIDKDISELDEQILNNCIKTEMRTQQASSYFKGTNYNPTKFQFSLDPHGGRQAYVLGLSVTYASPTKSVNILYMYDNVKASINKRLEKNNEMLEDIKEQVKTLVKQAKSLVKEPTSIKDMMIEVNVENKRKDGSTYTMKHILDTFFKVDKTQQAIPGPKLVEKYTKHVKKERIEKFLENDSLSGGTLLDYEFIYKKNGKFVKGEYYAHEYDEYINGKARRVEYSSGTVEFEVKNLDKEYCVMDGMWAEEDAGASRLSNGCGDHFTPFAKGLGV